MSAQCGDPVPMAEILNYHLCTIPFINHSEFLQPLEEQENMNVELLKLLQGLLVGLSTSKRQDESARLGSIFSGASGVQIGMICQGSLFGSEEAVLSNLK